MDRLSPLLARLALGFIVLGLGLRIVPSLVDPAKPLNACDAAAYWELAKSLTEGKGFTIDDGDLVARCSSHLQNGPSHHYSPLLPILEAGFILLMGANVWALAVSQIVVSIALVGGTWWATRDLYGKGAALLVTAAISIEWSSVVFGSRLAHAENLVLLTFLLTMWAILRSLQRESAIVYAGLFAGLGYLSKASIGWFFLLAGLGGLAWRLWHHGWKTLTNRSYLLAIAVFGSFVVVWSARNLALFWDGTAGGLLTDWQTSEYNARAFAAAFARPERFLVGLVGKFPLLFAGVVLPPMLFWPKIVRLLRLRWRDEATSGLLLAAVLVFVLGWMFAGAFWVVEGSDFLWLNNVRYVTPALVPIAWLRLLAPEEQGWMEWGFLFGFSGFEILISRVLLS